MSLNNDQSVEKYIMSFDSLKILSCAFLNQDTFLCCNKHYKDIVNISSLKYKKIWDIFENNESKICYETNMKVIKQKKKIIYQVKYNKKKYLLIKIPVINKNKVSYIICTGYDITNNDNFCSYDSMEIIDNCNVYICKYLPDTTLTYVNNSFCNNFNKTYNELIGTKLIDLIPENRKAQIRKYIKSFDIQNNIKTHEHEILKQKGEFTWQRWTDLALFNEKGEILEFQAIGIDITKFKQKEKTLQKDKVLLKNKYEKILDASPSGIIIISIDKILYANTSAANILGYETSNKIIGKNLYSFINSSYRKNVKQYIKRFREYKKNDTIEVKLEHKDRNIIYTELSGVAFPYDHEEAILLVIQDITEKKEVENKLRHMANHDVLTNLPNRYKLNEFLEESINKDIHSSIGILIIDIDRFKFINDTKGNKFGDELLKKVSQRLCQCVRDNDIVSRYSSDEFVILLYEIKRKDMDIVVNRILKSFYKPIYINKEEIYITVSIGISLYPEDTDKSDALIKNADIALNIAKEKGKNNYVFYNSSYNNIITRKMSIEKQIRAALKNENFDLVYQPLVNLDKMDITGLEALIRFKGKEQISPAEIIPVAEETGLIIPLGKWIINRACKDFKKLKDKYEFLEYISINISVVQLQNGSFLKDIQSIIKDTKVNPEDIQFEITESIMQDISLSKQVFKKLKELGINIAIDDFGTGFSSLSLLEHLPADCIKIDYNFVKNINKFENSNALVKTIINIGLNLNMNVTAEGIETKDQLHFLKNNNCLTGQGYLIGKPMSFKKINNFLNKMNNVIDICP